MDAAARDLRIGALWDAYSQPPLLDPGRIQYGHWPVSVSERFHRDALDRLPRRLTRVLEIGCGYAPNLTYLLSERDAQEAVGIDLSEGALAGAAALRTARSIAEQRLRLECRTLESFETTSRFDAVLCIQVLNYSPDPEAFVARAVSLVRPGGHLLLADGQRSYEPFAPLAALKRNPQARALFGRAPRAPAEPDELLRFYDISCVRQIVDSLGLEIAASSSALHTLSRVVGSPMQSLLWRRYTSPSRRTAARRAYGALVAACRAEDRLRSGRLGGDLYAMVARVPA